MTSFTIRLADINIAVDALFDSTKDFCADYLTDGKPDFKVTIAYDDITYERQKSKEGTPDSADMFSDRYLESLAVFRKIAEKMPEYNVFLMHGSVISYNGKALMFTAPSGTGKTTHTRLWQKKFGDRIEIINGDKPLIRVENSVATVYGTPWMGKEGYGRNTSAVMSAVYFLHRAAENSANEVTLHDILPHLLNQVYRPDDASMLLTTMKLIDSFSSSVKFISLGCNMDISAAEVAESALNQIS